MPLQFYSPNSKNTGGALSVSFNSKERSVYINIIQQNGWDDKTKKGSFKGGKTLNFKLSIDEVGGLIYAITNFSTIKFFHAFGEKNTTGQFSYYEIASKEPNKEAKKGFGLSLKSGDDQFKVAFTMGSAQNLCEYLKFSLNHCYNAIYSEDKKRFEESLKKKKDENTNSRSPLIENNDVLSQDNSIAVDIDDGF